MFFLTFYKNKPQFKEIAFQNRFYHDNSDKFISKISETINPILKPVDPYRFIFHNSATYTGKSTIRDWKNCGLYIRNTYELLQKAKEGVVVTSTQFGYWIYGIHRLSRILIMLIPMEHTLVRIEDYVHRMTKEYFARAYV